MIKDYATGNAIEQENLSQWNAQFFLYQLDVLSSYL